MQLSLDSGHCTGLISIESSDFLRQISSVKYRCLFNLALTIVSR
jgi:hypothetical protein